MLLNASFHYALLGEQHYDTLLSEGATFCKLVGVRTANREAEMSVWLSHVAIRYGVAIGDDAWRFGFLNAELSNRAYRDNLRHNLASCADCDAQLPFKSTDVYVRIVNGNPEMERQVVAYTIRENNEIEVIDMANWRWRDLDKNVTCANAAWLHDDIKFPYVQGADWKTYGVLATTDGQIREFKCARAEAAEAIDEILTNKLSLTPKPVSPPDVAA